MSKKNIGIIVGVVLLAIIVVLLILFGSKKEVTFDSAGGSQVATQEVKFGGKATKPKNPTREGYTFGSWYLDDEEYDFDKKVTKNLTLIARWIKSGDTDTEKKYTVSFNTGAGSDVDSIEVEEDGTIKKPANPTRDGYKFVSWQLNGKDFDFKTKVTKDMTLTAKWEKTSTAVSNENQTKISLSSGNFSLTVGNSKKVTATVSPKGSVTWSSSNSKIATVDKNGNIKAVSAGTATITATAADGTKKSIKVTVTAQNQGNNGGQTNPQPENPQPENPTPVNPQPENPNPPTPVDPVEPDLTKYTVSCPKINDNQCRITITAPNGQVVSGKANVTTTRGTSGEVNSGFTMGNTLFQSGYVTALN